MAERNILVIAPHADDEILGCGGTIAKHVASGDAVRVLIATDAHQGAPELYSRETIDNVRSEARKAHQVLGIEETIFLDFPAPSLDAYPSYKISLEIAKVLTKCAPSVVYVPFPGDIHLDHFYVHRASLVAARPQGSYTAKEIYCYETLSETEWATSTAGSTFCPNYFVDVSGSFAAKIEAMMCFESQLKKFPHPRSLEAMEALAKFRGATIGVERAEAFCVERLIA